MKYISSLRISDVDIVTHWAAFRRTWASHFKTGLHGKPVTSPRPLGMFVNVAPYVREEAADADIRLGYLGWMKD
jgi:hypothetical protein